MSIETACAQSSMWKESVSNVSSAMGSLGTGETASLAQKAASGMMLVSGAVQTVKVATELIRSYNTAKEAANAAAIAINTATGPIGWGKIAAAVAATAAATAVCSYIMAQKYIRADLSSASGRTSAAQTAGAIA